MSKPLSKSEASYTAVGLQASLRADGRALHDYRPIVLSTGVAPLSNGSSRVKIGDTDVVVGVKLEVEGIEDASLGARSVCSVECTPAAFPHLDTNTLLDLSADMTNILTTLLNGPSVLPSHQLIIIPQKRRWLINVDAVVLSHAGNLLDALFIAVRAALWDTKVPKTRSIAYRAPTRKTADEDDDPMETTDTLTNPMSANAVDFELEDYWDEGDPLEGRDDLPVCMTLNILQTIYFLDATEEEEACAPTRFLIFVKPSGALCSVRKLGGGEVSPAELKRVMREGATHGQSLIKSLNMRLRDSSTASSGSSLGAFN